MFSPLIRDCLRPEIAREILRAGLSTNSDSRVSYPYLDAPISDIFPNYGTFLRQDSNLRGGRNMFQVFLNVSQFGPEEITVKVVGDFIVVHGKHDEMSDKHGLVGREFTRRYKIPEDVDSSSTRSVLDNFGVLAITASKKILQPVADDERLIPLEIQRPMYVNIMAPLSVKHPVDVQQTSVETTTSQ